MESQLHMHSVCLTHNSAAAAAAAAAAGAAIAATAVWEAVMAAQPWKGRLMADSSAVAAAAANTGVAACSVPAVWEAVMAAQPWKGRLIAEILNDVMNRGARLQFGRAVPQQYSALAESCCLEEPQDRPTFDQIVGQLQGLLSQAEQLQQAAGASFGELTL
jgi:hypothetical protein